MSKVLIVSGSARRNSNTRILAEATAEGARLRNHEVSLVEIGAMSIGPCRGCEACHQPKSGGCVVDDDMRQLYPKVTEADILIFASPIYWFNMCGQIKQFLDRLYAVAVGTGADESPLAAKKIGAIFVYGDVDPVKSGCINAIRCFQDICAYSGATWLPAIYGSAMEGGEIGSNTELIARAKVYGEEL